MAFHDNKVEVESNDTHVKRRQDLGIHFHVTIILRTSLSWLQSRWLGKNSSFARIECQWHAMPPANAPPFVCRSECGNHPVPKFIT